MDFSNEDLKELIGSEFKGYEVIRLYQPDIIWEHPGTRKIELDRHLKSEDQILAVYDIDTKKFYARIFSDDFEIELKAIEDFHDRVLKMVAKKEAERKKQASIDKASSELSKAFQNYFKAMKASESDENGH